ncbi:ArsC family reductase [Marinomonas sp. C2222]|uniref:ArsC family reductase n=1 Tax=Marinomonas sargassi TaxID=2984494 RepID=A0ABT2YVA8_9GAMM|nr:ArsC family reductase [Marinomonas sargassi]MCV2403819.1 ArsC family reductase [Marinomonas sargassi]
MVEIYGIKSCDTMKKAFRWLEENNIEFHFHDYKKVGLDVSTATSWIQELGWENVINKRGTTWRKLDEETKSNMNDELAVETIVAQTSMIKRPLIIAKDKIHLGFKAEDYAKIFL